MTSKIKRRFKRVLKGIGIVLLIANVLILVTGNTYLYKAVFYNFVNIDDYKIFENSTIEASTDPQPWPLSSRYEKVHMSDEIEKLHIDLKSVSFLVIQNDSVLVEKYWDDYTDTTISNSFSMAKSFVSTLIGIALYEGKIKSLDETIDAYLPDIDVEGKDKITIRDVLMMASGLDWGETYADPFSVTTKAYYGKDLRECVNGLKRESEPGTTWRYKSGDTQILAFIVRAATGKTCSQYMEEKLWRPTGATSKALWSLDHEGGDEKAYCCINSHARDFARIGKLYLDGGAWNGKRILSQEYITMATTAHGLPTNEGKKSDWYGYQWWIYPDINGHKVFYARGLLGQNIFCIPDLDVIMVRLGHKRGERIGMHPTEVGKLLNWVTKELG